MDIVDLIGARVTLKKAGSSYKGCCPFHLEKTPSFHVNPAKQFYHCFGCQAHGDVFTFLMKQDGLTFMDAVRSLAEKVGVTLEERYDESAQNRSLLYSINLELSLFYQRCLNQTKEGEIARNFLKQRQISQEVSERFGVGYAPMRQRNALIKWAEKHDFTPDQMVEAGVLARSDNPANPYYDRFRGRLIFPIHDRMGRVVGFSGRLLRDRKNTGKYVNSPETDIFVKSRILYGLDKAASVIIKHPRREALICEGQVDVIRCHASGFENAVAAQGTAFTPDHVNLLKKSADSAILLFDGDAAGTKAALRTGALFLEAEIPVKVAPLPEGQDPDSLLRDKGTIYFRELLNSSISLTAFQVQALQATEEQPDTIDAINRISRSVLETLAICPNAVQRAHLVEEAANLMHLPVSALQDDLERLREDNARRAAFSASLRSEAARESELQHQESPDFDTSEGDPVLSSDNGAPALPPQPTRAEMLLCELLIEHEHDPDVQQEVARYLPLELISHPFTLAVLSALAHNPGNELDPLASLVQTTPPLWQETLGTLLANKQKVLYARDATGIDAAQDLIRHIWIRHLKECQGAIAATDDSPEVIRQRFQLSITIKQIETAPWERIIHLLTPDLVADLKQQSATAKHHPQPEPDQPDQPDAAPSVHEADNAYEVFDPAGSLPNEYLLDEMPDL